MIDRELKENLVKAFQEKLKKQILDDGHIFTRGRKIAIKDVGIIHATLQNDLNIIELLSENGTNLRFEVGIKVTVNIENDTLDENYSFSVIGIRGKYILDKNEFDFNEKILFNLLD